MPFAPPLFEFAALFGGRRQAGEIERHAPQQAQRSAACVGCSFSRSSRASTNRSNGCAATIRPHGRHRDLAGSGLKRPVLGELRRLRQSSAAKQSFCSAESASLRIRRRHPLVVIVAEDPPTISLSSGFPATTTLLAKARRACRAAIGFTRFAVGPVAAVTFVGKDRADVAAVRTGRPRVGKSRRELPEQTPAKRSVPGTKAAISLLHETVHGKSSVHRRRDTPTQTIIGDQNRL